MTDKEYYELQALLETQSNFELNEAFKEWKETLLNLRARIKVETNNAELTNGISRIKRRVHCYASVIIQRDKIAGKRAFRLIEEL